MKGGGSPWDQRIRRATDLAVRYPFAAEGLSFYGHIASFQKSLYEGLAPVVGTSQRVRPPGSLRDGPELSIVLPWFAPYLSFVQDASPLLLAQAAAGLNAEGETRWGELLDEFWQAGGAELAPTEALIAWTFLQPYAEYLADHTEPLEADGTPYLCPLCSGPPLVGVLRPQGDGGKRSLICSLCAHEWDFRRIVCSACGEESVDKLPVYIAEELPHVRVEACDTCHHYLKTIDLTKDGHAMPVVDELAAIPLSLWAAEKGYTKLCPNLLGL
ncbi:MAG TPA: formate dehydrogenase accessory protein FdhE [Thermoanaerobaculia bacterium]|jgi:FdhE protein